MRDLSTIIPPPESICWRAAECVFVLVDEYRNRLTNRESRAAARILATDPGRMTWKQSGTAFRLYSRRVEVRV
jgi:hypothetical protein